MLRVLFFFSALFGLHGSLHAQSVTDNTIVNNVEDFLVTLKTNNGANSYDIFEEGGQSNNSGNPHKLYIPIINPTATTVNTQFSYYPNRANLPQITTVGNDAVTTQLTFSLDVDVNGNQDDLHVAAADSATGSYFVIATLGQFTDAIVTANLSLQSICNSTDLVFDCGDFATNATPSVNDSVVLFFFLNEGNLSVGDQITPGNFTGEYYEVNFSNRIFNESTVNLSELTKGDSLLRASYSAFSFTSGTLQGLFAHPEAGATNTLCDAVVDADNNNDTIGGLGLSRSNLVDLETAEISGRASVKNLENNRCYTVRLFWCDRFGFCSFSSQAIQNTPEDIEALLEKQACFFFTAGFGEEHYIVNYFQVWRDQVLKKYALGRAFIKWYYGFAPQHTPYILERPWLQKMIQGAAYVLYGVIHGFWFVIFLMLLLVVQFLAKYKARIQKLDSKL